MAAPALSVVIPTRDRAAILRATLDSLRAQGLGSGGYEVIVVDDGCVDGTATMVAELAVDHEWLRIVTQPASGPAAARNRGIGVARGDSVLLLGDDTVPAQGTLARHLELGRSSGCAVQGRIDWDPSEPQTRVMRFLAPAGPQFYFVGLEDRRAIPYTALLGSNMSAPRRWFLDEPFDEGFTEACFEDTELAYRWWRRGRLAIYAEDAVCHHRHVYRTLRPFLRRHARAGRWARRMVRLHPATTAHIALQPVAFSTVALVRAAVHTLMLRPRREDLWDLRCRLAFALGFLLAR